MSTTISQAALEFAVEFAIVELSFSLTAEAQTAVRAKESS
jgi:hypothetical protein